MPLQRQVVELSVAKGMNQGVDRRILPNDEWARLVNVVTDQQGAAHKRPGYGALPSTVAPGDVVFPAVVQWADARQGEMVIRGDSPGGPPSFTVEREWSWAPSLQAWHEVDYVTTCATSSSNVTTVPSGAVLPKVAVTADAIEVWCWQDGGAFGGASFLGPRFLWRDSATGAVLHPEDTRALNWVTQKVVAIGSEAYLLGNVVAGTAVDAVRISPLTDAVSVVGAIATLSPVIGAVQAWDAAPLDAGRFLLATAGPLFGQLTIATYDAGGAVVETNTLTLGAQVVRISVTGTAGTGFRVCYGINVAGFTVHVAAFGDGVGIPLLWNTVVGNLAALAYVAVGMDVGANVSALWQADVTTGVPLFCQQVSPAGALVGFVLETANTVLRSKPFAFKNRLYAIASPRRLPTPALSPVSASVNTGEFYSLNLCQNAQNTAYIRGWNIEGVFGEGMAFAAFVDQFGILNQPILGDVPALAATRFLAAIELQQLPILLDAKNTSYAVGVTFDFAPQQSACPLGTQYQNCLARSGAQVGWCDGEQEVELGYEQFPRLREVSQAAGSVPAGTYLYQACYEWTDAQGNRHLSDVAALDLSVTVAGSKDVTLSITTLGSTRKGRVSQGANRDVQIAVFRTDISGQIFFRLTPPNFGILNDPTVPTVAFVDTTAVAAALGFGQLYTSGDALANRTLPGSLCVISWNNRLWSASADDGKTLWFSKLAVQNEAPGFSEALTLRVDDATDSIVAFGAMDDKLIVFTGERMYYVSGDGPNDTGEGGAFNGPIRIASDGGCVDARSVVSYPNGVMYGSPSGIYECSRAAQVTPKGLPVLNETTDCTYLSTWLDAPNKRIYWLVTGGSAAEYTGPRLLVFDYAFEVWTIFVPYRNVEVPEPDPTLTAQLMWQGHHLWATSARVAQAGAGFTPWTDSGVWFEGFYESPWVKTSGVSGYSRAYRVTVTGKMFSSHTITLDVLTDYDESTVQQSRSWVSSSLQNLPVERVQLHLKAQLGTAYKIRLYDSKPAMTDRGIGPIGGFDVASVAFEIGVKPGSARLPSTNRG
jgi:hypothetical protein